MVWMLIIGAVAGWLAGNLVRGHGFGLWIDMIVGVIGAFIGNFLFSMVGIGTFGVIGSFISSLVGAVIFVYIIRMFSNKSTGNK